MELKLILQDDVAKFFSCSNRTFMELKRITRLVTERIITRF